MLIELGLRPLTRHLQVLPLLGELGLNLLNQLLVVLVPLLGELLLDLALVAQCCEHRRHVLKQHALNHLLSRVVMLRQE